MAKKKRHDRRRQPPEQPEAAEQTGAQHDASINAREQAQADAFNTFDGTSGSALGPDDDSAVDEASAESFPASDPPAWTRDGL